MRIGVTYDLRSDYLAQGMSEEESAEFDSENTIAAICGALAALGHDPIAIGNVKALNRRLAEGERWDAVFNICEGLKGFAREAQVPILLDAFDIPAVFSDPLTLSVALDKSWAKRIVRDQGVPTAKFFLIEKPEDIAAVEIPYPVFLKPVAEGSGKGVNARSRAGNAPELRSTALNLLAKYRQPVLVEEYLPGREFTVGITGTGERAEVLGVMEIVPTGKAIAHGYGYENKEHWEDKVSLALVHDDEAVKAGEVALHAWRASIPPIRIFASSRVFAASPIRR
jgi:D-alanine-D-alanine ligase